jgi:hypothetical protein
LGPAPRDKRNPEQSWCDGGAWRQHVASAKGNRRPPIKETLRKLLKRDHDYDKGQIAELIMKDKGVARATAYRWIDQGHAQKVLRFNKTIETYALA